MQEKNRTKLLAGLLVGTLGFATVRPDEMITKPLNEREANWITAQGALLTAEKKENDLIQATSKLRKWAYQSLPPEPGNAQRVYRSWINDLAEECGFDRLTVQAGSRSRKATRDGDVFHSVQVKVEGDATLADLSRFLYRFKRADLLQRVESLNIVSEDTEGDPYMTIDMTVEGICMQSAEPRLDLFAKSPLSGEVEEDTTTFAIEDTEGFPSSPGFQVKVGQEYMEVTQIAEDDGTWTVKRGLDDSQPESHSATTKVQYIPVASDMADTSFEQHQPFLANNPFVKPREQVVLKPRINTILDKKLVVGTDLKFKVTTTDIDEDEGAKVFALAEGHPEGMTIDKDSGEVKWDPDNKIEVGAYPAEVLVTQLNNDDIQLKKEFKVNVVVENDPPDISVPRRTIPAWLGQAVTVPLKIKDETPGDKLEFDISGVEGAYVDSETLVFTWQPAEDIDPGEYEAQITVKDAGGKESEGVIKFRARDDAARYTRFTMAVGPKDQMEALLFDQINDRQTKLTVGSKVSVADIKADVKEIGARRMVLTTLDGDMEMALGDDLRTTMETFAKENPPEDKDEADKEEDAKTEGADEKKDEPAASADDKKEAADEEKAGAASKDEEKKDDNDDNDDNEDDDEDKK